MGENLYFLEKNDTFVESKINNFPPPIPSENKKRTILLLQPSLRWWGIKRLGGAAWGVRNALTPKQ